MFLKIFLVFVFFLLTKIEKEQFCKQKGHKKEESKAKYNEALWTKKRGGRKRSQLTSFPNPVSSFIPNQSQLVKIFPRWMPAKFSSFPFHTELFGKKPICDKIVHHPVSIFPTG